MRISLKNTGSGVKFSCMTTYFQMLVDSKLWRARTSSKLDAAEEDQSDTLFKTTNLSQQLESISAMSISSLTRTKWRRWLLSLKLMSNLFAATVSNSRNTYQQSQQMLSLMLKALTATQMWNPFLKVFTIYWRMTASSVILISDGREKWSNC